MFWEWLERTLFGFVAILVFVFVGSIVFLMGAIWLMLYKAIAWLAILVLVFFVGVPVVTLIYTLYDNWFLVTEFFENLKEKWNNWGKKDV